MSLKKRFASQYPTEEKQPLATTAPQPEYKMGPTMKLALLALLIGFLFLLFACLKTYRMTGAFFDVFGIRGMVDGDRLESSLSCKLVFIHAFLFTLVIFGVLAFYRSWVCCDETPAKPAPSPSSV